MHLTLSMILSALLLSVMILSLTLKPEVTRKMSTVFMLVSAVGGLYFYGFGYAEATGDFLQTVVRTPMTVLRMYIGVNDLETIKNTNVLDSSVKQGVFWLTHLMAFYSMASAAMYALGAEALRYLRFVMARHGDLTLIYGINENSIALGRECVTAGEKSVVFVSENVDPTTVKDLNAAGMSVLNGAAAVRSEKTVIRRLRVRKRKMTVYALAETEDQNLSYALRLKESLKTAGVPAENTRITIPGAEDILAPMLQVSEKAYGFGYVNVFDDADLASRALIRICPPWELMHFDKEGRATENFECVVIGFGRHGQAALKALVMNGQFAGSRFRATVFSLAGEDGAGYLEADSPELLKSYDIQRIQADARGSAFFSYIKAHLQTLKMIVVCTGNKAMNREISDSLMLYLARHHAEDISVIRYGADGVRYQENVASPIVQTGTYTRTLLSAEDADHLAILLNSTYDSSGRSDWEKWLSCDSFGKMSSRASADFIPAFIRISGSSREEILSGNWNPDPAMQQVLGETEHLRWCAFHYAMGYVSMSAEEFDARAKEYLRKTSEGKPAGIKIAKDPTERKHACLIPWEELDELSARENRVTGRNVDYKQIDINNVMTLPKLLQSEENAADKKRKGRKTKQTQVR